MPEAAALDRDSATGANSPIVQAAERVLAHEDVNLALAFEQPLDQSAADEACCSRYEIGHEISRSSISRG